MPRIYANNNQYWTERIWPQWTQTTTSSSANVWPTWTTGITGTPVSNPYWNQQQLWNNWTTSPYYYEHPQTTAAWQNWNYYAGTSNGIVFRDNVITGSSKPPAPPTLSPKLQLENKRRKLIAANRRRSVELRRKLADRRAEQLLLDNLTADQRKEWITSHQFHVVTADGQRTYRIKRGVAGNIYLVKDRDTVSNQPFSYLTRYCCHIYGDIPVADNVLTQKLLLESNEDEFLALANVS